MAGPITAASSRLAQSTLACALLAVVLALPGLLPSRQDAPNRVLSGVARPAQATASATEPPPITPCPTPATPLPPGIYPIPSFAAVEAVWQRVETGGRRLALRVCIRNNGPAPWDPRAIRVQGCVERRIQVKGTAMESFDVACTDIPVGSLLDAPCVIQQDAECEDPLPPFSGKELIWTGPVATPVPPVTASPAPSPTATADPEDNVPFLLHLPWADR